MSLASVLPFLAALKKQVPDAGGFVGENNVPGSTDTGSEAAWSPNLGSDWGNAPPSPQPAPTPPAGQPASQPISQLPNMDQPGMNQAPQVPDDKGNIFRQPYETKGHALLRILQGGLTGGLSGLAANAQTYAMTGRNAGFGGGAAAGYTQGLPFQSAMQQLQLQHGGLTNEQLMQMLPFLRAQQIAGLQKTSAEAQKASAEAGKATAETGAIPVKTQLEQAQAEAANYKEDPNLGLIDLRTGQPIAGGAGTAPLTAQEAAILGKQPGESVPLKIKNQANEMVNRGIKSVSANGRQLLVDNQGNTIKDMGQATPMAVINAQMAAPPTGPNGALSDQNMETVAQAVAAGKEDMATALRPYMRFPGKANALEARVLQVNPDYYQGDYQNRLKVLEKATQGSWADQKIAFNTAIQHADLLRQAAQAVNNGDIRTINSIKNSLASEFGDADYTNLQAIANAYNHEVTSVISKGHMTDTEVKSGGQTLPLNSNFGTINKVLGSYQALMKSKMNMLQQQIQQGQKGSQGINQPNTRDTVQPTHRYNPQTGKIEAIQ